MIYDYHNGYTKSAISVNKQLHGSYYNDYAMNQYTLIAHYNDCSKIYNGPDYARYCKVSYSLRVYDCYDILLHSQFTILQN